MKKSMAGPAGLAILAAVFYALNAPFSKLLLRDVDPSTMASLLYLGAGVGMALLLPLRRGSSKGGSGLTRADAPYAVAMVVLEKICATLGTDFGDIMKYVKEQENVRFIGREN